MVGTVTNVYTKPLFYSSCPDCKKKINENGDKWSCEKCSKDFEEPIYRYIVSIDIADCSGQNRVQLFDSEATILFGMDATSMNNAIKEMNDTDKDTFVKKLVNQRQFLLKCVIKMENYNNEMRKKTVVNEITKMNYITYGRKLHTLIDSYE